MKFEEHRPVDATLPAVPAGAVTYAVCIVASGEGKAEMQAVLRKLKRK